MCVEREGGVDSGIRRMFYFCRISGRARLNTSLSRYKDKYIIEGGGAGTETCGMTDVRLSLQPQTFVTI